MNYIELMGSREVSRSQGSYTASRTFLVYKDSGSLTVEDAVNYSGGVSFSDQHPDISGIYANNFSIKASNARKDTWELTWSYAFPTSGTAAGGAEDLFEEISDNTEISPVDAGDFDPPDGGGNGGGGGGGGGDGGGGGGGGEDDVGEDGVGDDDEPSGSEDVPVRLFTGVSITTGLALVDGYVAGATIPSNGTQTASEIDSGTTVHVGGEAVTVPVPTTDVSLTVTTFGAYYYLNNVQLKAGKRNAGTWYGFNAGSVIFKGMSVSRTSENSWDSTYNFVWDAWSHMRQVPDRNEDGEPDFVDGVLKIYFKQPFPDTTSFAFTP